MWRLLASLLAVSYVMLLLALRSIVLPLKAVLMNVLSVGAALGILVAVFQWGILDGLLGYESPGYVDSFTPPLLIAIIFGLSTDYELFLLNRVRERWLAGESPHRSIAEGLAASAGAISSAALILICAFGAFATVDAFSVKQIGVGTAVAIAIDATLIRLALVPASMEILGKWNWWWPTRLAALIAAPSRWFAHVRISERAD
jgi:RND superfamily putative drug exporter